MLGRSVLGFSEFLFMYKMDMLKELIEETEKSLSIELNNFERNLEDEARGYSQEQREEYFEYMSDEYWKYKEEQPQIVRVSFFLQSYFSFEHFMFKVCNYFKAKSDIKLEVKDISGQGLEKAKIYISKVIGISSPFQSHYWAKIQYYNQIRNAFVHNAGKYDENNKKQGNTLKNIHSIDVKNNEFILNNYFCLEVIETFVEFTSLLKQETDNLQNRRL
ncbi:hypothetical protein [Rummeliibacillus suwonensis]|uniref:hypothetical protein n=1 Tax=Rummeliibacillus suwonensis TaxID=1306154 RepID=UPI001AB01BE0|nr:hypothetical protein [Rummeliibacillus suwonensis]MBO2537637.1 hypothetical protein [Rummeliibacillus suwonensis]